MCTPNSTIARIPTQEARLSAARASANLAGLPTIHPVNATTWYVPSATVVGEGYKVIVLLPGYALCTCPAGFDHQACWHVARVLELAAPVVAPAQAA